jgi:glutaredoxin
MAVKLHRCGHTWLKVVHPCWTVQKALDDAGLEYEIVKHPWFPERRRTELERLSGQTKMPVIELEDGTMIREESEQMAARVREGRLGASGAGGA